MKHAYYLIILNDEKDVDEAMKKAANLRVQVLYKIGVYGKERQHELFLSGHWFDCYKFIRMWKQEHK